MNRSEVKFFIPSAVSVVEPRFVLRQVLRGQQRNDIPITRAVTLISSILSTVFTAPQF
jgi:hypothetical protein